MSWKYRHPRWFSVWLDKDSAPWAYAKEGKPQRAIAALEAYGTLLSIRAFSPQLQSGGRGTLNLRAYTDNQGNASALGKLATSKFPLNCVVMELAANLKKLQFTLDLRWLPRELNAEADRLSKGELDGFDPRLRVDIDAKHVDLLLLDDFMKLGLEFHEDNQRKKLARRGVGFKGVKRKRGERLRDREPW